MGFRKIPTIQVSERVFELACSELDMEATDNYVKIDGYLENFVNGHEEGYVLAVSSSDYENKNRTKENLYVWACEARNSDDIVVMWQTEYPEANNNMCNEDTYKNRRKHFKYNETFEAARFIVGLVKKHFAEEFK